MPCSDDGKPETRPPLLVTASVDRIALARRLALDADLTMAGSVIWTGRSALDIRMQLRQVWRTCSIKHIIIIIIMIIIEHPHRVRPGVGPSANS